MCDISMYKISHVSFLSRLFLSELDIFSLFTQERSPAHFKATRRFEPVQDLHVIDSRRTKFSYIAT